MVGIMVIVLSILTIISLCKAAQQSSLYNEALEREYEAHIRRKNLTKEA